MEVSKEEQVVAGSPGPKQAKQVQYSLGAFLRKAAGEDVSQESAVLVQAGFRPD